MVHLVDSTADANSFVDKPVDQWDELAALALLIVENQVSRYPIQQGD